jgi:DNA adenine methylase
LINFWRILRDESSFQRFQRMVEATPFARPEWEEASTLDSMSDPVVAAVAFFVTCRQSLAGRGDSFTPLSRKRTRRHMNEQCSAWLTCIEGLAAVHDRLKRVVIENIDAIDLIRREDGPETIYYCDPPYLQSTRTASDTYGGFEMSEQDHRRLLDTLAGIKGRFLLSGYRSDLYHAFAEQHGWGHVDFDLPNNAAGGKSKRRMVESVWMNHQPGDGQR